MDIPDTYINRESLPENQISFKVPVQM